MELFYAFAKGFLFSISLCCDLGMVNVAIIKAGIERGFKSSFMIGFGSCFGDLAYLSLALLGLTILFEVGFMKWLLWIVGTFMLLYLTFKMIHETVHPKRMDTPGEVIKQTNLWKDLFFGIGVALSSPTVIVWFAVVAGPIVADVHIQDSTILGSFIGGFFIAGVLWSVSMALISSRTGKVLGTKFTRSLSILSAILFFYFAVKVFLHGLGTVMNIY